VSGEEVSISDREDPDATKKMFDRLLSQMKEY
jgi:hypothetical protein